MSTDIRVPTYDEMMNPLLQALHDLGGSGTISEIDGRVIEIMDLFEMVHHLSV
jgi:restriction system protein